ncbi:tryptophan-rich sensory protein [Microbacterium aurantiacum]|uniref:tryptophan-rich sensory protein n=1 Tax=Microbacterium aurantiacum TaxID=162393 RepID=UPI00343A6F6C
MSTTAKTRADRRDSTVPSRGIAQQIIILVSSVLAIVAAFIGSGAFFGTPIQEAAGGFLNSDSTLIAPGTGAFRIWSVIYTGMLAYAIWQALPAQRNDARQARIGWWVAASLILNAIWIGVVQADLLWLSLPVIAALLAVLCRIFVILRRTTPKNKVEIVVADGAIGLYLGWVIIATAANATAILVATGFDGFGIAPQFWSSLVLGVAAIIGIALAFWGGGRIAPALSLSWGVAWVAVARFTDEPYSPATGVAAIVAVVLIVVATVVARIRHDRTHRARARASAAAR